MRRLRIRNDRGAVAIVVAAAMTALLVAVAMVLDFGLVRLDRQMNKSSADAATLAGLRGLDRGDPDPHSYAGICQALTYLRLSQPELASLPDSSNAPGGNVNCPATGAQAAQVCQPGVTDLTYSALLGRLHVQIKSPYSVDDGSFAEEDLDSLSGDNGEGALQGCDQLGVILTETKRPGLGSLATSSDLVSRIRSVGRVAVGDGDIAPALILLEPTRCGVLTVGSSGSPSRIKVYAGGDVPATIHADSTAAGADCGSGSNQQLFQGKQTDGVVAYGTTAGAAGTITSVAALNGVDLSIVADSASNVYGTTAINESSVGTKSAVLGRKPVTRLPADERYLDGLSAASQAAYLEWTKDHSAPAGYTRFGCPSSGDMTTMAGLPASSSVYIDCPGSGITLDGTITAGKIYFHGFIKGGKIRMPNATEVYVDNTDSSGGMDSATAMTLGTNDGFCVRATLCDTLATGTCSSAPTGTLSQARVFVRRGSMESTGGLLRLCNTTVVLGGGQLGSGNVASPGSCLPLNSGTPPTATPCPGASSTAGNGYLKLSGETDWVAPNRYGDMKALDMTYSARMAAWNTGEDLALWTETYGDGPTYKMAGGGKMHVGGVFMVPNAFPFTITGNGAQDLTDAQFITRSFAVDGGATLTMKVDPFNAISIPELGPFVLVR